MDDHSVLCVLKLKFQMFSTYFSISTSLVLYIIFLLYKVEGSDAVLASLLLICMIL